MKAVAIRAARVFAAMLALAVVTAILADVINQTGQPWRREYRPPPCGDPVARATWNGSTFVSNAPQLPSLRAVVSAGATSVRGRLVVEVPLESPLVPSLQEFAETSDLSRNTEFIAFASTCLARFLVDGIGVSYERMTIERANQRPHIRMTLTTAAVEFDRGGTPPPRWARIEVISGWNANIADSGVFAAAKGISIRKGDRWPDSLTSGTANWKNPFNETASEVAFHVLAPIPERNVQERQFDRTFRKFVEDLPWQVSILLSALEAATPFVLLVIAARSISTTPARVLSVTGLVAASFLAFYIASILWAFLDAALDGLESVLIRTGVFRYVQFWSGNEVTRAALTVVLLPIVLLKTRGVLSSAEVPTASNHWLSSPRAGTVTVATLSFLFAAGLLIYSCVAPAEPRRTLGSFLVGKHHSLAALPEAMAQNPTPWAVALIGLILAAGWLCREILLSGSYLLAFVLLLALVLVWPVIDASVWEREHLRTWAVMLFAIPFVLGAVFLLERALRQALGEQDKPAKKRFGLALLLGAIALTYWLSQPRGPNEALISRITGVIYPVVNIGVAGLLVLMIAALREASPVFDRELDLRMKRTWASMLILAFLLWPSRDWLDLVVTLGSAGLFFRYWTFTQPPPSDTVSGSRSIKPLRLAIRAVMLNTFESQALEAYRKARATKLSEGAMDLEAYSDGIDSMENQFEARQKDREDVLTTGLATLTWGPDLSPWERGLLGAKFGALVGAPWAVLFLVSSFQQPVGETNAAIVSFVLAVSFALIQWSLFGFLFLYFYPYIRGSTGLQKGLAIFTSIAAPALAGFLIVGQLGKPDAFARFFLWLMQLFVTGMVLGLVCGDYWVLRKAKLGWRQLLDIHRFGSLAAWLSSVLVAIGAAIAAALSTQAVDWLADGVRLFTTVSGVPAPSTGSP